MNEEIAVIGLGKFGLYFGSTLTDLGYTVIGLDRSPAMVQAARDKLKQVYQADATNPVALEQAGLRSASHVLVSVGDSIAASSMIAMYLKEMNIPNIWVKAVSPDHQRLLLKLGVHQVIIPEQMAAIQLASSVAIPGFLQYATFDPEVSFQELTIDKWTGKTLRQLDLIRAQKVHVLAVKQLEAGSYEYSPDPDYHFQAGDKIIILRRSNISKKITP